MQVRKFSSLKSRTNHSRDVTCKLKKIRRSVKHIYFLPTLNSNARKNKRACPFPTLNPKKNKNKLGIVKNVRKFVRVRKNVREKLWRL